MTSPHRREAAATRGMHAGRMNASDSRGAFFFDLGDEESQTNNNAVLFQLLWLPGVSVNFAFC